MPPKRFECCESYCPPGHEVPVPGMKFKEEDITATEEYHVLIRVQRHAGLQAFEGVEFVIDAFLFHKLGMVAAFDQLSFI